jgi:hypothetical protein
MKKISQHILTAMFYAVTLIACTKPAETTTSNPAQSDGLNVTYNKNDLKTLSWLAGNWKGMDGDKPFYEIYRVANDSTLEIISYEWNGKDSTKSSLTAISWKDGFYYLGDSLNWKVTSIAADSIAMIPNYKAFNDIVWKKTAENGWDAILDSRRGKKIYRMERVDHFKVKQ